MWAKGLLSAALKKFGADKVTNAVKEKAAEDVNTKGIGKFLANVGAAGIAAVAITPIAIILPILALIIIIPQTFNSIFIIQGLDKAYADTGNENNGSGGRILLVAGHSYEPYCNQAKNECRPEAASGYSEPDETRSLVKLVRSELSSLGANVDIANELLAPGDSKMNASFFVEGSNGTEKFNNIDWSKYSYVLEVHFNAIDQKTSGPQLVKTTSNYSTAADDGIISAVTSNLGTSQNPDSVQDIFSISYFTNLKIPITYLETEFYDNKSAMDNYTSHKNQVAKDIAQVIYDTYGQSAASSVLECARNQIGKPYVFSAAGPDTFDCSGLVTYCYQEALGVTVPHYTVTQYSDPQFTTVSSVDQLTAGDIILDGGSEPSHVGIYTGNGTVVHAPRRNDYVREVSLSEFYGWVGGNETFRHYTG